MFVRQVVNRIFDSNTWVLKNKCNYWLVDCGDWDLIQSVFDSCLLIKGVFLTHGHFDHIYGLNQVLERFPEITVYASEYGKSCLYSDKLNFSRYHETSFVFEGKKVVVLRDGDQVVIGNRIVEVMETPGHDPGCLCYKLENYFFTGDSFIPGIKTVTNLRGGDKEANKMSLEKIRRVLTGETIVCPGHGNMLKIANECLLDMV